MTFREKSAVEGVFSAAALNLLSRVFLFLRHVLITAYIGLAAGLDAFNVAFYLVMLLVMVPGDLLDSLGIPHLVRSAREQPDDGFRDIRASVLRVSLFLSLGVAALLAVSSTVSPRLAAGFSAESRGLVARHLFLLLPMALFYLPYRALGSVFRARRLFHVFFFAEAMISAVGLAVYMIHPRSHYMIPAAWSAGYVAGFLLLRRQSGRAFGPAGRPDGARIRELLADGARALPSYAAIYLLVLSDFVFASFLPTGSVSAISYGLILSFAVPGILNLENIFMTPLSERNGKGDIFEVILKGILYLSIPIVTFTIFEAEPIIRAIFRRGAFDERSVAMTAAALVGYAAAIPYFFLGPLAIRTFLVLRKMRAANAISLCGVAINAGLNYLLAMRFGMGIAGISLATAVAGWLVAAAFLHVLRRHGVPLGARYARGVVLPSLLSSAAAIALVSALPVPGVPLAEVALKGTVFVGAYLGAMKLLPIDDLRRFEARIREGALRGRNG